MKKIIAILLTLFIFAASQAQIINPDSVYFVTNYYKIERSIPMRDGVKLFTSIYIPKDATKKYPIMMTRSPYSCAPYGENKFRAFWTRNTKEYFKQNYIIVLQDVRGAYMSEGVYEDVRPFNPNKKSKKDVDEASDTYDAIDWMIKNIPTNTGNVGVSGISYPGFYSTICFMRTSSIESSWSASSCYRLVHRR